MADREKRPRGRQWIEVRDPVGARAREHDAIVARSTWTDGRVLVVSALELAELPGGDGARGPQWHVSISRGGGKHAKPHEVRSALRAFGMVGSEEDNHEPGCARHFWLPVDPAYRGVCECKTDEDQVVTVRDGQRHVWSNAKDPAECRGCVYAAKFGPPCPIHGAVPAEVRSA